MKQLGKEQGEVARQSTENFGHDDACQEAVEYSRKVVLSRLHELTQILNNAETVVLSKDHPHTVRLGAIVELSDNRILRIGSYMVFASHKITNISYNSPLSQALINKREGDIINFRDNSFFIKRIT